MRKSLYLLYPLVIGFWGVFASQAFAANLHVFTIQPGTGSGAWNSAAEEFEVEVGDTVRIVNNDTVVHRLHTNHNRPCEHGPDIAPNGGVADHVILNTYDPAVDGPLHDHYFTTSGFFWMKAIP